MGCDIWPLALFIGAIGAWLLRPLWEKTRKFCTNCGFEFSGWPEENYCLRCGKKKPQPYSKV